MSENPMDILYKLYDLKEAQKDAVDLTWVDTYELPEDVLGSFTYYNYSNRKEYTKITLNSKYFKKRGGNLKKILGEELDKRKEFSDIYGKSTVLEVLGHEATHKIFHEMNLNQEYEEGAATIIGKIYKFFSYYKSTGEINAWEKSVKNTTDELNEIKRRYDKFSITESKYLNEYIKPALNLLYSDNLLSNIQTYTQPVEFSV